MKPKLNSKQHRFKITMRILNLSLAIIPSNFNCATFRNFGRDRKSRIKNNRILTVKSNLHNINAHALQLT